jgi:hypothetical protein
MDGLSADQVCYGRVRVTRSDHYIFALSLFVFKKICLSLFRRQFIMSNALAYEDGIWQI